MDEGRRRKALSGAIQWTYSAGLQLGRVRDMQQYMIDHRGDRPTHYGEAEREPFLKLAAERQFLLVSLNNVLRALALLDAEGVQQGALTADERKRIRLLRNIFEHWDADPDSPNAVRSLNQFCEAFPNDDPERHTFSTDGSADSIGGLDLGMIADLVEGLRKWLLALEAGGFVWTGRP